MPSYGPPEPDYPSRSAGLIAKAIPEMVPTAQIMPYLHELERSLGVTNAGASALPLDAPGSIQVRYSLTSVNGLLHELIAIVSGTPV